MVFASSAECPRKNQMTVILAHSAKCIRSLLCAAKDVVDSALAMYHRTETKDASQNVAILLG